MTDEEATLAWLDTLIGGYRGVDVAAIARETFAERNAARAANIELVRVLQEIAAIYDDEDGHDVFASATAEEMADTAKIALASCGVLPPHKRAVCTWHLADDDTGEWAGDCGAAWCMEDGNPEDNHMHFCPECGRVLVVKVATP